jgi:hypothetical protein
MTDDVTHDGESGVMVKKKAGRPPGAKNKATLLREAIAGDFDRMLEQKAKRIFEVVANQALDGCRQSQKMILDRIVPTVHAESDKDKGNKFSGGVHITIGSLEGAQVSVSPDIEDAEYTQVEE